ncbi:MAG: serine/threonine protein kinase [Verrucomicrobiae bacterium]|nr:serine/threonine protein kinase [Verrucomicrobiae bacterium]
MAASPQRPATTERRFPADSHWRDVVLDALEREDPAERTAFLDEAFRSCPDLRARAESLIQAHTELGGFLEQPALGAGRQTDRSSGLEAGERIGRYVTVEPIGEGGCGRVYLAEQEEPVRRRVALKVIKPGMDSRQVIARFEAERQALALMDHPCIARVFDAGTTAGGRPYFVMEWVRGERITEYAESRGLSTEARLRLFVQVCQAIEHAHQKGVLHRDIKPSNILVIDQDGAPLPKVIDFGIAKAMETAPGEGTLLTEMHAFLGTPAYMSPEQASMGRDIDTRSDVYALGVLLYELLAGSTPFEAEMLTRAGLDECRRILREVEPERPSRRLLSRPGTADPEVARRLSRLRGDLDWIVMKCLEKDRARRYATVSALVEDLERHLSAEPVVARPPSPWYRLGRFTRRHRGVVTASMAVLVTLLAGVAFSSWQAVRATRAERRAFDGQHEEARLRREAERERALAQLNEYVADINLAQQSIAAGNFGRASQLVEKHAVRAGATDLRGFEWRYLKNLVQGDPHVALPPHDGSVHAVAFSPDGNRLAVGLRDAVHVWEVSSRTRLRVLPAGGISLAFLPDGRFLATAGFESAGLWDLDDGTEVESWHHEGAPMAVSGDGRWLAISIRDGVWLRDLTRQRENRLLAGAAGPLAFSGDSALLVSGTEDGLRLWRVEDGNAMGLLEDSDMAWAVGRHWLRTASVLAVAPDGRWIVAARNVPSAKGLFVVGAWEAGTGREWGVLPADPDRVEHTGVVSALTFHPTRPVVATGSWDHSIRLWDIENRRLLATLQGSRNEVWAVAFSPDGAMVASGAKDGEVRLWPVEEPRADAFLAGFKVPLGYTGDGRRLAVLDPGEGAIVEIGLERFEVGAIRRVPGFAEPLRRPFAYAAGPGVLAVGDGQGDVQIWERDGIVPRRVRISDRPVVHLELSPDGRYLLGRDWTGPWTVQDLVGTGWPHVVQIEGHRLLFAGDGRTLIALPDFRSVARWDMATGSQVAGFPVEPPAGLAGALSFDGNWLAVSGGPNDPHHAIRLWDTRTGDGRGQLLGHKQGVRSLAFSTDGRTLASSSDDSTTKLWNLASLQELLSVRKVGLVLSDLAFSPDDQWLTGAGGWPMGNGGIHVFRAPRTGIGSSAGP